MSLFKNKLNPPSYSKALQMKIFKLYTLTTSLTLLGASCFFSNAYAQLMFSQYIDGNSNKKGLQILNPDNQTVNLADYEIRQFSNGSTTHNLSVQLQGTLSSQAKFLVGKNELQTELGGQVNQTANLAFNGDDAIVLYYKGTPIDRFGRIGERPSEGWGTTTKSVANSFKRTQTTNNVTQIDPNAAFDLDQSWKAWSNRNDFSNITGGATTIPEVEAISCSSTDTPIADLNTAMQNQQYTVRGVITADYRYDNGFSGFYIQTPNSKAKANLSNAIFVYIPSSSTVKGGHVGEEVILRGELSTYQNQLQLGNLNQDIITCNQNASTWVTPLAVNLPFDSLTDSTGHVPKRYQGMLVTLPQTLTVSENYNYGRYGELALSAGRLYIPTNLHPANSAEAKQLAQQNLLSKIIFDDGYNNQNRMPWLPTGFNAGNTLRSGYQIKGVQGILEYRFNSWRVQPILNASKPELIADTNPRNTITAKDHKQIRAAAFNVLNYDNGATGFPTERGATNQDEFDRQHAKIVAAMKAIDADVYALMEIANNGYGENSAIAYLSKALGTNWKYVIPENVDKLGNDAIAVAIIYNAERVKPINTAQVLDLGDKNRTTIAQSFQPITGGKIFTVIPNHLKSKGCGEATGTDADQGDGQGCWNLTRLQAVQQLMQWIAKNPTGVETTNALLLGDMNSYAKEDPILAFERANYKVLINDETIGEGKSAYSYIFGVASNKEGYGGAGNLDYAIADESLYPLVKRTFAWHINADEPTPLDYNQEYKSEEQIELFYAADAYRSSDHDPIIVDLDLNERTDEASDNDTDAGSFGIWSILLLMALSTYMYTVRRPQHD